MAFWIGFALFSAAMVFVWGFFFVAKLHVFKFKDYSHHVAPATKTLFVLLVALTVAGYTIVFTLDAPAAKKTTVAESAAVEEY